MDSKSQQFVHGMRKAGKMAAQTLNYLGTLVKPGMTTLEIDGAAADYIKQLGGKSACLGYRGYPFSICTSPNEILCHGIPDTNPLQEGDILNIDVTVIINGYHGDCSKTYAVGEISEHAANLIKAAEGARDAGIRAIRPFGKTGEIGFATSQFINKNYPQFSVNKDYGGHGIGQIFHDAPFVPGNGLFGTGSVLKPWTCITVEPIIWENQGFNSEPIPPAPGHEKCDITLARGLGGLATQFEHTVLITATGYEILTELK